MDISRCARWLSSTALRPRGFQVFTVGGLSGVCIAGTLGLKRVDSLGPGDSSQLVAGVLDGIGLRSAAKYVAVSSILGRYCCVLGFGRLYLARPPVGTGYLGILWSATSSAYARQVSVLA